MKLRNKKTGQEGNFIINKDYFECVDLDYVPEYRNLAELNKEWEDAPEEEPKGSALDLMIPTLINFIENEPDEDIVDLEDCKRMLEKLKAWQRLKDKGFKFTFVYSGLPTTPPLGGWVDYKIEPSNGCLDRETLKDLDLLFGGEE